MLQPLPLALVVGAAGAWPLLMTLGDQVAAPPRAGDAGPAAPRPTATAVPRSATMTLECTAPTGLHAGAEGGPLRLTCKVHGLELVLYSLEAVPPRFWETVDPFDSPGRAAAPAPAGGAPSPGGGGAAVRGLGIDDLIDPIDGATLLAGRTVVSTRELLDPYAEDQPARPRADELLDPFTGRPPPPLPLPLPGGLGEDPDGVVPLPR